MPQGIPFFSRLNRIRGTIWILKNLMLLVNVLSLIASVGFFIVGLYGYSNASIVGVVSTSIPLACIILGVCVAGISLIGCFGAANESRVFLRVYFIVLVIVILCQIIIAGVAFSHKDDVEYYIAQAWDNAYNNDKEVIKQIQNYLGCCGFKSADDRAVKEACVGTTPCYQKMKTGFMSGLNTMGTIAMTLGIIELLCLLSAGLFVYFSQVADNEREIELLDEARKLRMAEEERAKSKRYNFETPFADDDDE